MGALQEIKKQTEPNHPDFHDLEEALQKINMVVTVVNEATRHAEMVHKMLQIQSRLSEVRPPGPGAHPWVQPTRPLTRVPLTNTHAHRKPTW